MLRAREEDVPGRTTGRGVLSHGSKFGLNEHYPQGSTSNKNTALARRKVHQHVALLICTLHLRWDSLTPYIVIYDSRIKATLGFNVSHQFQTEVYHLPAAKRLDASRFKKMDVPPIGGIPALSFPDNFPVIFPVTPFWVSQPNAFLQHSGSHKSISSVKIEGPKSDCGGIALKTLKSVGTYAHTQVYKMYISKNQYLCTL